MKKSAWKRLGVIFFASVMILSNSSVMALAEMLVTEEAITEEILSVEEIIEEESSTEAEMSVVEAISAETEVIEEQIIGDSEEIVLMDDAVVLAADAAFVENWGVDIKSDHGYQMFPGTTATLTASGWHEYLNEVDETVREYPEEMTYEWAVTNMDGTTKNCPVTITANGNTCELLTKATGSSYAVYIYCDGYYEGGLVAEGKFTLDVEHFAEAFGVDIQSSRDGSTLYAGAAATLTANGWHDFLNENGEPDREYPENMTYEWVVMNADGTTANCPVTITANGNVCELETSVTGSSYAVNIYCEGYYDGYLVSESKYIVDVEHFTESWGVDIQSDSGNAPIHSGTEINLTAGVRHEFLNENGDPEQETPEGLTYNWTVVTSMDGTDCPVTVTSNGNACVVDTKFGVNGYTVTAYCDAYLGEALVADDQYVFEVPEQYYKLEIDNLEALSNLHPGEELGVNGSLVSYVVNEDGKETMVDMESDIISYRFGCDLNMVQITDATGKVLTEDDRTGTAPFKMKKIRNGVTDAGLVADLIIDGEVHTKVAEVNWQIRGYDYSVEFAYSYGGRCDECEDENVTSRVITDIPLTLTLDESGLDNLDGYEVEWNLWYWDEAAQTEVYDQQIVSYEISEDGKTITLTGNEDHVGEFVNVEAVILYNDSYICSSQTHVMVDICEHVMDAGTVAKAATCIAEGTMVKTCANCGMQKSEEIKALGHTGGTATCTKAPVCGRCEVSYGKAKGHSMGAWTVLSKATVFKAEQQKQTCKKGCGHSETKSVGSKLTSTIKLTDSKITLKVKQSTTGFKVTGLANGDSIKSIRLNKTTYVKISNINLAKGTFKLTARKKKDIKSTTKLIITLASGLKKEIPIKVQKSAVKTTGITGVDSKLVLKKGKKVTLTPARVPFTSKEKFKYSTSNKNVVKVSSKGQLTAVAPGTAKITVKSGKKKVTCKVTVPGIGNVKSSATVKRKKTLTLKPKLYGISGKAAYSSSNPQVASVNANGKVTGVGKGTATITIKAGGYIVNCKVKVK